MNSYSEKTVLITGATGLIGNNLVDAFMKMGDVHVIALSRNMEKLEKEFFNYKNDQNFKMIAQDISNPLLINELVDYIFHAAGSMEGKIIKNCPVDVIKPNIIGTMNCLEFLRNQEENEGKKGRMVLFSSVTVYGNDSNKELTVKECDTNVTETLESMGAPYSQSKRMIEVITSSYVRQYGLDAVIGRFSTVYGPTRIAPDTAFFEFVRKGISGEDIYMNSSGLPQRDNIYIDDAIKGVLTIGAKGLTGEAYNISSNGDMDNYASVDEIAQVIAEISDKDISVKFKDETKLARKPGIKLDNQKLKDLGWDITVCLKEGIKKTLNAMRAQYERND